MKTNILITGGDGFIGAHVSRILLQKHNVSVLTLKLKEGLLSDIESEIQLFEGDIANKDRLEEVIGIVKPSVIIHLAAFGIGNNGVAKSVELDPETAFRVNVTGTYNLFEVANANGVKQMILSSSTTVYPYKDVTDVTDDTLVNETLDKGASNLYGLTKQMVEKISMYFLEHNGLPSVNLRLPLVYGPGRWYKGAGGALVNIFESVVNGGSEKIQGCSESIDLMYVKDVAYLIDDILENPLGVFDIVNVKSHTTSIPDMVDTVNEITGNNNLSFERTNDTPLYPLIDTSRMETRFHFKPRYSMEDACMDYIESLKGDVKL